MTRTQVIDALAALKAEIFASVSHALRLFSSHARDSATASSDIDLVVAFHGPATFDAYIGLKHVLEDRLEQRVDLATEAAIRPEIKSTIKHEAIHVA
jgi:uncharacterized protein